LGCDINEQQPHQKHVRIKMTSR